MDSEGLELLIRQVSSVHRPSYGYRGELSNLRYSDRQIVVATIVSYPYTSWISSFIPLNELHTSNLNIYQCIVDISMHVVVDRNKSILSFWTDDCLVHVHICVS